MLRTYLFACGSPFYHGEQATETHTKHEALNEKNVNSLPHEDSLLRVSSETSGELSLFILLICIMYYRKAELKRTETRIPNKKR